MFTFHVSRSKAGAVLLAVLLPAVSAGLVTELGPRIFERSAPVAAVEVRSIVDEGTGILHPAVSAGGVGGTTQQDLDAFAAAFNDERIAHSLAPVPANFRYDPCMEQRLFWMAEDPSPHVASAWGHLGSRRSDGVPSVGCDGNLAGGLNDTGATVAVKWWKSVPHRIALYKPPYLGGMDTVCIDFAMTHGGLPDESTAFARAAARWRYC